MPRLDQELVRRGLARSRTHAAGLLAAGRVQVDGASAAKASMRVDAHQELSVTAGQAPDYVSRAGHKLAGALAEFDVVVPGRRCLDAGASTGGFTEVLLRNGAAEVVAVDVGHGQLVAQLREDPRVTVHEGMNVRYLRVEDIGGPVQLTVADLSFISLTLVLEPLAGCTRPGGDLVLMVKPQFEVGRDRLSSTGVVTAPQERLRAVTQVLQAALDHGLMIEQVVPSTLPGQDGNLEYFLWLKVPDPASVPRIDIDPQEQLANALDALEKTTEGRC